MFRFFSSALLQNGYSTGDFIQDPSRVYSGVTNFMKWFMLFPCLLISQSIDIRISEEKIYFDYQIIISNER